MIFTFHPTNKREASFYMITSYLCGVSNVRTSNLTSLPGRRSFCCSVKLTRPWPPTTNRSENRGSRGWIICTHKKPMGFFKAKKQNPWRNSEAPRILGTLRLSNLQTNLVKPENFQISQTPKNKTVPLVFFFWGGDLGWGPPLYHLQITDLEKDEVRALGGLLVASSAGAMEGVLEASPG